ncbi:MAG: hypothetical protein KC912_05410 [Proteobacteria bacterium]|nr:hypothetical protein [Pseudomonadota bacterium]
MGLSLNRVLGLFGEVGAMACVASDLSGAWVYELPNAFLKVPVIGVAGALIVTLGTVILQSAVLLTAVQRARPLRWLPRLILSVGAVLLLLGLPAADAASTVVGSLTVERWGISELQLFASARVVVGLVAEIASALPFAVVLGYLLGELRSPAEDGEP